MKRAALGIVAIAMLVGVPLAASTASAAPSKLFRNTIVLTCDRTTGSAAVTLTFRDSLFGSQESSPFSVSCGPDSTSGLKTERLVALTAFPAGAVNISTWTFTTGGGSGGCPGASVLPYKSTCSDLNGVGSQLVVR